MKYLLIALLILLCGCSVVWTDYVFVATLGKNINAKDALMIADANSIQIGSNEVESKNDKITAATAGGVVITK
jgi:hypothetical protein